MQIHSTGSNSLKNIQKLANEAVKAVNATDVSFDDVYQQAVAATQFAEDQTQNRIAKKQATKKLENIESISATSSSTLFAQNVAQVQGVAQAAAQANVKRLNEVPLQLFLDKAVNALNSVSRKDNQVNKLIEDFVAGKVGEDDVVIETAKLNLLMTMLTTIVQTSVQTFKEIMQIPV